ncbi:MAG: hypothetical protein P4L83_10235 [Nevskia sp.]|nr:hypothetical protein [Nevskia sp.]
MSMLPAGATSRAQRALALLLLIEFAALVAVPVYLIPLHVSFNYNEGWNAYLADIAIHGGLLYPPPDAMFTNNYPPLSFYIVGAVGRLIGDNVVAGRLTALLSALVTAGNVFLLGRWLGAARPLAAIGAGAFLLGTYAVKPSYFFIDDPQFLSHALVSSGAVVFLTGSGRFGRMLLAAALIAAAGLVKHNVISLPLALCTWALVWDRRRLGRFLAAAVVVGAVALALVYAAWGQALVDSVLHHARLASLDRSIGMAAPLLPYLLPYLLATLTAAMLLWRRPQGLLVAAYLLWSAPVAFWMMSGSGVNYNVAFDLITAVALGAVALLVALEPMLARLPAAPALGSAAALLLVLPFAAYGVLAYRTNPYLVRAGTINHSQELVALNTELSKVQGDVACETLAICYWAGKPMEIDFFNYGQKIALERLSSNVFSERVDRRQYAYILIEKNSLAEPRLPVGTMADLLAHYQPVRLIGGYEVLLAPAAAEATPGTAAGPALR